MPYIKQLQRQKFKEALTHLTEKISDEGELNYLISSICHIYLGEHGIRYCHFNSVLGALEAAKFELYRQHIALYEDLKASQNGTLEIPTQKAPQYERSQGC